MTATSGLSTATKAHVCDVPSRSACVSAPAKFGAPVDLASHDIFSWLELGHTLREKLADTHGALKAYKEVRSRHPTMSAIRRMRQWLAAVEAPIDAQGKRAS